MPHTRQKAVLIPERVASRVLLLTCGLILCIILFAGLSPFTSRPRNEVKWVESQAGLIFGEYATILGTAPLSWEGPSDGPCSIELWFQPGLIEDSNTMMAFDSPGAPVRFRIKQSLDDLALARSSSGQDGSKEQLFYIPHALLKDTPLFITLTTGKGGISVYLDGVLVSSSSEFGFSRGDLSGRMVVGTSPWADESWSGVLRGIALYGRELSGEDVRRNYADWSRFGQPKTVAEEEAVALFEFNERVGTVIHNQVPGGSDLYIPDHYLVLHPRFMEPFWRPTNLGWGFWKDALTNVAGFVPLGFFFCMWFSRSMPGGRAILLTIILGCALSFFIEATQYYLPTRDSDSRDWLNNTVGTIVGAVMYCPGCVQRIIARLGIVSLGQSHANPVPGDGLERAS